MAFDDETLKYLLRQAGFRDIERMAFGRYSDVFAGLDFARYQSYSLYVEAQK